MDDVLPLPVFAVCLAVIMGFFTCLAARVRRRGTAGAAVRAAMGSCDEALCVTAHDSHHEIRTPTERPAPAVTPTALHPRTPPPRPRGDDTDAALGETAPQQRPGKAPPPDRPSRGVVDRTAKALTNTGIVHRVVDMDHRTTPDWEERLAAVWATLDDYEEERSAEFRAEVDKLVALLPGDSPVAPFERACAFDSTGHSDRAVPLYQEALARGLDGYRARRTKIQLASSLRNTGRAEEGVALLTPELDAESDELDDAVRATLALCLANLGREREGLSLVLGALAPHLPRYQRSMSNYARLLVEPGSGS